MFDTIQDFLLVVYQPKLGHVDEFKISVETLFTFGRKAKIAVEQARAAMASGVSGLTTAGYLSPGKKQCRWCRAAARCPALAQFVQDEVGAEFETINAEPPVLPGTMERIVKAYEAVPLIEQRLLFRL